MSATLDRDFPSEVAFGAPRNREAGEGRDSISSGPAPAWPIVGGGGEERNREKERKTHPLTIAK